MMEGSGVEGEAAEGEGEREVKEQEGFVREESWGKGRREGEHMRQREDRGQEGERVINEGRAAKMEVWGGKD